MRRFFYLWMIVSFVGCTTFLPPREAWYSLAGKEMTIPKSLPDELTPLSEVKVLSRGGLAFLMMMELPIDFFPLEPKETIVVDISDHWARKEILSAVRLGLMSVFPNHRFDPDQSVTRGEAAQIFYAMLTRQGIAAAVPSPAGETPTDLPEGHLLLPAVRYVLALGIMRLDSSGRFSVSDPLTGPEAQEDLLKIRRILLASRSGAGK
jgi:hypothetical protein